MKKAIKTLKTGIIAAAFFTISAIILTTPIIILCLIN
tara:strand:- start:382 stop:492 length:111 start_codon:yes stop_codon:yes gene_type:complete